MKDDLKTLKEDCFIKPVYFDTPKQDVDRANIGHVSGTDIRQYFARTPGTETSEESSLVDDNNSDDGNSNRGSEFNTSMASIIEINKEAYESLALQTQIMGYNFFDYVFGKNIKDSWRYVSDVILVRDPIELPRLVQVLHDYGRNRSNGMFGFSVEEDHIHVIHDCAFSGGQCRDVWRTKVKPFGDLKPVRKFNKPVFQFKKTDWYDVFIYFFLAKRGQREIWTRGEGWKAPHNDELLRWEKEFRNGSRMVQRSDNENDTNIFGQGNDRKRRAIHEQHEIDVHVQEPKTRKYDGKFAEIRIQTKALLLKYHISPLISIRNVLEFRNNLLLSNPKNKDYVIAAIDDFGKTINDMSLRDIFNMINDDNTERIFIKGTTYGNVMDSLATIDNLLKYQYGDEEEQIINFLEYLVDVLDRRINKLNTICVIGPPSSGKNFFFDMILAACLSYGQLTTANKFNNFAFQDAPDRRVIMWNEPNYCSSYTDFLKTLLGGDACNVRVKNIHEVPVSRTPVIVLTNTSTNFMNDSAFDDRIVKFSWSTAPFLRDVKFKPHPLSFFLLLKKYNIDF